MGMNLTRNGLIVLISVIFVAGVGTAYAGMVLPMITLAGDVTITGDMTCPGCVDSADITDGTILFSDINQNGCATNQIMKWNGASWVCAVDGGATEIIIELGNSASSLTPTTLDSTATCPMTHKVIGGGLATLTYPGGGNTELDLIIDIGSNSYGGSYEFDAGGATFQVFASCAN